MAWWLLTVALGEGDDVEVLADRLRALGATGVAEPVAGPGTGTLAAGFPDGDACQRALAALGHPAAAAAPADPDAWVASWRATSTPTRVGPLVVRAPWHPPPAGGTDIVIDPGPTFGHGGHPTTRLVLARLPALVRPGAAVLDVGCGSGVLGVAAAALGAGRVVAVDTDPAAVAATASNAAANGVAVEVHHGTVGPELGTFDVVLANLLAPVLRQLGPGLVAATAPGGRLVASGLLAAQRDDVAEALRPLAARRVDHDDGWALLELAASTAGAPATAPSATARPGATARPRHQEPAR